MVRKTIVLVACSKRKAPVPCKAKDMYQSIWFKLARAYAEEHGDRWYILSAMHGLLEPDDLIHPYNKNLAEMTTAARMEWAEAVYIQLARKIRPPGDFRIVILGSKLYASYLAAIMRRYGYKVLMPLVGMGIGEQQRWLKEQRREK